MPIEHEPSREPQGVRVPLWAHQMLLLLGACLTAFSLVRNDGRDGALVALGAGAVVLAGALVARRYRR